MARTTFFLFFFFALFVSVVLCIPPKKQTFNYGEIVTLESGNPQIGSLVVSINTNTGAYEVVVDGTTWFEGPLIAFHLDDTWFSSATGNLKLQEATPNAGSDPFLGAYKSVSLAWNAGSVPVVTTFKSYATTQAIVFQITFPSGAQNTTLNKNNDVITAFPHFTNISSSLNYLTFQGMFGAPSVGNLAKKNMPGGIEGGPVFAYTSNLRTVGISPLDNFMVSIHEWSASLNQDLTFGINGKVLEIPVGWEASTILFGGQGIRTTVLQWGAALLGYYGKTPATLDSDLIISDLGYWTDDGGYYWYNTEPNKDYQTTIIDVMDYIRNISLPVKNFQLDSWWYYKGKNNGVYTWTPQTSVFPNGMEYVQEHLQIPFALHNRYFSPDTPYQQNYSMVVESYCALPQDERLFYDIMAASKSWGNVLYEQDWLITTYENMNVTQNNVTAGRLWLVSMGEAASKLDMTIQYCMPLPLHLLQSVEIQAVTQSRVSGDYVPGTTQWTVGYSSMLLWGLGLVPYRDDFWSTADQPDCYNMDGRGTHCWEPNTNLMALTASLTAGPVGPSDKIGSLNKDLIMYTSRADGKLLKADYPAMPLDVIFSSTFNSPTANLQLWQSSSTISGLEFHYIFAAQLSTPFTLQVTDLPNTSSASAYLATDVFSLNSDLGAETFPVDSSHPLVIPTSGNPSLKNTTVNFRYYVASPRTSPCILIGELGKFITVSPQRVQSITVSSSSVQVALTGAPNEPVTFVFVDQANQIHNATVTLDGNGSGSVSCP